MSDIHLTRELLRALAAGRLPIRFLAGIGLEHLLHLCPHCREELAAWEKERTIAWAGTGLQVMPILLERRTQAETSEIRAAERDFRELIRLDRDGRLSRIRKARTRFRGLPLARLLLAEAEGHMPAAGERVYEFAETAYAVLLATPDRPGANELVARALALMANGLRTRGDLPAAERRMETVRTIVRRQGVTDPAVCAEIDWLHGLLRKDQRRLRESEDLLVRSVAVYGVAGDRLGAARSLISLGLLYYERSELAQAGEVTRAALGHLDPDRDLRLWVSARHNLALFLCEAGRYDEAAEALEVDSDLYERFPDDWTQLRRTWLEGKIAAGLHCLEEAEQAFLRVRRGFETKGDGFNAALVSLDLALVYVELNRTAELKDLATETCEAFRAREVHREALAALLLFQDAARSESLSAGLVQEVAGFLRRARGDASLRFRAGGGEGLD